MIRAYTKADTAIYKNFENFIFAYPDSHNISFNYGTDTVTIDSVAYAISTLANTDDITNSQSIDIESSILSSYEPTRTDDSTTTQYFGFIKTDGSWYIMKIDSTTGIIIYTNGTTDFTTNWTNRATLTYVEFNSLTW